MKRFLLALAMLLASCNMPPKPSPDAPPQPYGDAAEANQCTLACDNLRRLGCPEGRPTRKNGDSCELVCEEMIDGGVSVDLRKVAGSTACP